MQLAQIIRRASARAWALALIPALALAALTFLVAFSPATHRVTATIGVTAPSGAETAATITQAVDSFRSALTTPAVRDAAAEEVGLDNVPENDVASTRVGISNFVDAEVSAEDREDLEPLVYALMRGANDLLYTPARNAAEAQQEAAQEDFDALQEQIEATSPDGVTLPVQKYQAKASEVTQLRVALAGARARGSGEANGLQDSLDQASRDLRRLAEQVGELEELSFSLERARTRLADTTSAAAAIDARLIAANEESSVKLGSVVDESQATVLLRALVAGLVVGIAVAIGFVLLIGALRRGEPDPEGSRGR